MIRHLIVLAALSAAQPSLAEDVAIPRIETRGGRPVLMVDGGPFTILGEQMNTRRTDEQFVQLSRRSQDSFASA
jgi:hypothetical protein